MALALLLSIPIISILLSLLVSRKTLYLECIAVCAGFFELAATIVIIWQVIHNNHFSFTHLFSVDALGALVLGITSVVGFFALIYSVGYLRVEMEKGIVDFKKVKLYFLLVHTFLGAMITAIVSANPIGMWIAIEATTLSTTFLVSFYNKSSAIEAAWKYLVINSIGLLLGFFGMILYFTSLPQESISGFVDWNVLILHAPLLNPVIAKIAFIFVLIGFGTKVGLAPMHTWLPDAHGKAPAPVSALLSGTLLNIAFLAILRFKVITDTVLDNWYTQNLLIFFGLLSIVIAVFIIFVQQKYKRLLAYSSIEHMGIIALGFGFGGLGSFAALLHMIYHSCAKSLMFFASGNIFLKFGKSKTTSIKGMIHVMPITTIFFFIGFLTLVGVPPFGIFMTEFMILMSGISNHLVISLVVLILLVLTFVGFLRHTVGMVFGKQDESVQLGEFNWLTLMPLAGVSCILIVLSLYLFPELQILAQRAVLYIN